MLSTEVPPPSRRLNTGVGHAGAPPLKGEAYRILIPYVTEGKQFGWYCRISSASLKGRRAFKLVKEEL